MPSSAPGKSEALVLLIILVCPLMHFSFPPSQSSPSKLHVVQFLLFGLFLVFWGYVAVALQQKPDPVDQARREMRLGRALRRQEQSTVSGVSRRWMRRASELVRRVTGAVGGVAIIAIVAALALCLPENVSPSEAGRDWFVGVFVGLRETYSERDLFCKGLFIVHMVAFWGISLAFAALDLLRPTILLPFKIQQNVKLTLLDFLKACTLPLLNQLILIGAIHLVWDIYPLISPTGFDVEEIPSLAGIVVQLLAFIPFGELAFYAPHRLLHTDWMYDHVHRVHHSWTSPIAVVAIYVHPLEFVIGNIPIILMGPLLLGSHVTVWWVWTFAATLDTCLGHCGWHLPYLGSHEAHDYHHWLDVPASEHGPQNFGITGILDTLFGTNEAYYRTWRRAVSQTYTNCEYPVDKILASSKAEEEESGGAEATVPSLAMQAATTSRSSPIIRTGKPVGPFYY